MFWYIVLIVLTILFGLMAFIGFALFILSGCKFPEVLIIILILSGLAAGVGYGATEVEKANTIINTDVVQMEVTKCDITSVSLNGIIQHNCYITLNNEHLIKVEAKEYAKLNVGDVVTVEITTKTRFGEVENPTITLKG